MVTCGLIFVLTNLISFFLGKKTGQKKETSLKEGSDYMLLEFFEQKKIENEHAEIVRIGLALSTPLWLSHNYKTRKKIGEFIEEAASFTNNINARIKVLIDDLGWTNVELGLYDEAKSKLTRGIELAKEHNNGYYLAKGHRHLFGMSYRLEKLDKAEEYLIIAVELTNSLPQDKKKDELVAELHFAKSSLYHKKGDLEASYREIETAHVLYQNLPDKEWMIKILARKGEILLSKNKIEEAIEIFRQGLTDSIKHHFNRQIVKNRIGLGRCFYEKKELAKAKIELESAMKIAEDIGMFYEKTIISLELEKFKSAD